MVADLGILSRFRKFDSEIHRHGEKLQVDSHGPTLSCSDIGLGLKYQASWSDYCHVSRPHAAHSCPTSRSLGQPTIYTHHLANFEQSLTIDGLRSLGFRRILPSRRCMSLSAGSRRKAGTCLHNLRLGQIARVAKKQQEYTRLAEHHYDRS
jgi:hypothetical protein